MKHARILVRTTYKGRPCKMWLIALVKNGRYYVGWHEAVDPDIIIKVEELPE